MNTKSLFVVAGALRRADGLWLMQRRPEDKHHGGLWEFPGGKVEAIELPREALCRELAEELGVGIDPGDCESLLFAEERRKSGDSASDRTIVILLYSVENWSGEPQALEGGEIDWFTPAQIAELAKPPLDQELVAKLFAG